MNALEIVYEILIELWDIRLDLENGRSITEILYPPFDPFKTLGKYWNLILDTVSNDSSPSFLIPSPQELSDITSDERTLRKIAFRDKVNQKKKVKSLLKEKQCSKDNRCIVKLVWRAYESPNKFYFPIYLIKLTKFFSLYTLGHYLWLSSLNLCWMSCLLPPLLLGLIRLLLNSSMSSLLGLVIIPILTSVGSILLYNTESNFSWILK